MTVLLLRTQSFYCILRPSQLPLGPSGNFKPRFQEILYSTARLNKLHVRQIMPAVQMVAACLPPSVSVSPMPLPRLAL